MADLYILCHGDKECGAMSIDDESGNLEDFDLFDEAEAPFLGNANLKNMKRWWEARAVPASRNTMQEIIRNAGCHTSKKYLAKNLALSMTDTYWIRPEDVDLKWKDVNLFQNTADIFDGIVPYHNATSYDPNASLGGQMEKYWDIREKPPVLVKTAYKEYGQQALNEYLASKIHEYQNVFPFVDYRLKKASDNGIHCLCDAFTDEHTELVPAMEILDSRKLDNSVSLYDAYIKICAENGIDKEYISDYMDYQTLTDFVLSNTDEHLMNYGVLRNVDSMKFVGPAPIFDTGNSMFYADNRIKPYNRRELLERKITAIHDKEEMMLKHVKNKMIVKEDLLPSPSSVKQFYMTHGIPEERANFISISYSQKLSLFHDFQKGKTISLYLEKKKERDSGIER